MALRLLQTVNKEVIEIFDKELGNHGKRNSVWWLPIHLNKIQVRPGIEGHGVKNWGNTQDIEMLLYLSIVTGVLQFCYNCVNS